MPEICGGWRIVTKVVRTVARLFSAPPERAETWRSYTPASLLVKEAIERVRVVAPEMPLPSAIARPLRLHWKAISTPSCAGMTLVKVRLNGWPSLLSITRAFAGTPVGSGARTAELLPVTNVLSSSSERLSMPLSCESVALALFTWP